MGDGRWGNQHSQSRFLNSLEGFAVEESMVRRCFHSAVIHASPGTLVAVFMVQLPLQHSPVGSAAGGPRLAKARTASTALKATSRSGVSDPFLIEVKNRLWGN